MWELLERLLVPLDFVFLWQKHDHPPFPSPLDVSCFFSYESIERNQDKIVLLGYHSFHNRRMFFQSKPAASLYIAIKGSELPKPKHFS